MNRHLISFAVFLAAAPMLSADEVDTLGRPLGPVKPFTLTDQLDREFKTDQLKGKVWVVNFFFTRCTGGCAKLINNMADMQKRFAGNDKLAFVSITVDPEHDTPKVLYEYAKRKGIESPQWHFLTGDPEKVHHIIEKTFFQSVQKQENADPGQGYIHTFFYILVDERGVMKGYIRDGMDKKLTAALGVRIAEMLEDRSLLQRLNYLPTINASLNGAAGVFLLLGFIAVKRRWLKTHIGLMLTAFVVSMAFLSCYVYYHFFFMRGSPVAFQGQGTVRAVYFTILISHTFLAAIVTPMAIWTLLLGFRADRTKHMRLAKWTFPIWLYVSVTGVVIYVMLYHLYPPA